MIVSKILIAWGFALIWAGIDRIALKHRKADMEFHSGLSPVKFNTLKEYILGTIGIILIVFSDIIGSWFSV